MSSLVRMCSFVLLVTLAQSTLVKAESYTADLSAAKIVGASLRVYTVANPASKDLILSNMDWTRRQIRVSKKFVDKKDLSKTMKLKVAADTYTSLMDALIRLSPVISDSDIKKSARDRLIGYQDIVDTQNIDEISKTLSAMETEISTAIDVFNAK